MKLEEFSDFDPEALREALAALLEASSPEVRRVAEEFPGLNIRPLEDGTLLVYLLEAGDHEVHVGTIDPDAVRRTPPPSTN
jgi:hypothetical protein